MENNPRNLKRNGKRLVCVLLLGGAALLFLFRVTLLTSYASFLTGSETTSANVYVIGAQSLVSNPVAVDHVRTISRDDPTAMYLVVPAPMEPISRLKLRPEPVDRAIALLTNLGIANESIKRLDRSRPLLNPDFQPVAKWLREHSDLRVEWLSPPYTARQRRLSLWRSKYRVLQERINFTSFRDARFSQDNWWRKKYGLIEIFGQSLALVHALFFGPGATEETSGMLAYTVCLFVGTLAMVAGIRQRGKHRLASGLVLTLAVGQLTHAWTLPAIANWLDVSTPEIAADFGLVLNGDLNSRPFKAAELYHEGRIAKVLLTREKPTPAMVNGIQPPDYEFATEILNKLGVPNTDIILLPGQIDSTHDEAVELNIFLAKHPDAQVAIITNPFHTRRAQTTFRNEMKDRAIMFAAAPREHIDPASWWNSWSGATVYFTEFAKTCVYLTGYR